MAKIYESLDEDIRSFISEQKIFFVASAAGKGNVNLSPKGYDALRIIDDKTVCYLDYPGSGNETAVHIKADGRLTMMFCSFGKRPMILRLYGRGEVIAPGDEQFARFFDLFGEDETSIVRQVILLNIESVMTSCGYGVPYFDYLGNREQLRSWSLKKAKVGTLGKYMGQLKERLLES